MSGIFDFDYYKASADYVLNIIGCEPEIGIILGSGLAPLAEMLEDRIEIPYTDIPNFLRSTVPGHAGKLICGKIGGKTVLCMSGRFHSYEGYSFEELSVPVRLFKLAGVKKLILTNAAGAVNLDYKPGDIMIITDQIVFSGTSPMRGPNIEQLGPRFFDCSELYSRELIALARERAQYCDLRIHEGVYFWMPGPQFETPAEIRAIRTLGGDAVGMSTVTESLTAAHCGIEVLGMSVLCNMAAGILKQPLSHAEVLATASMIETTFTAYVADIIMHM